MDFPLLLSVIFLGQLCFPIVSQGTSACIRNDQCPTGMTCVNKKCLCGPNEYESNGSCQPKKGLKESCTSSIQCQTQYARCTTPREYSSQKMCLCYSSYVQVPGFDNCTYLKNFTVESCVVANRTMTTISLKWSQKYAKRFGDRMTYSMRTSSSSSGFQKSTANDGTVYNLRPGRKYTLYVTTSIAADRFYTARAISYYFGSTWTFPTKPGAFDPEASSLSLNPMTFAFGRSDGLALRYEVTFIFGQGSFKRETMTNSVTSLMLNYNETYGYEIVTLNKLYDRSEVNKGTFTTKYPVSIVRSLTFTNITEEKAQIKFLAPSVTRRIIYFYVLHLYKSSKCLFSSIIFCLDCPFKKVRTPTYLECGKFKNIGIASQKFMNDGQSFVFNVTSLDTYTLYRAYFFTITSEGEGTRLHRDFRTSESAPEDIQELTLRSYISSNEVRLQTNWIPGKIKGRTSYPLTLLNTKNGTIKTVTTSGTGYLWRHLKAFTVYNMTIYARTSKGQSKTITKSIMTATKPPSNVRNLEMIVNSTYPKHMTLVFDCPLEWNGPKYGFSVVKTIGSKTEVFQIKDNSCPSRVAIKSTQLGKFLIDNAYNLKVQTKNENYVNTIGNPIVTFQPRTIAPIFEERAVYSDNIRWMTHSVEVPLCRTRCLIESPQGEVINAGILVCVKSETQNCNTGVGRKRRDIFDKSALSRYATWGVANKADFELPYRPTPDDWIDKLSKSGATSYVIGQDIGCNPQVLDLYCNGPLPVNRDIVVTAFLCTSAGCQTDTPVLLSRSQASSGGDDSGVDPLIIIIIVVAALIVVVVIIGAFIWVRRQKKRLPNNSNIQLSGLDNPGQRSHSKWSSTLIGFLEKVNRIQREEGDPFFTEYGEISSSAFSTIPLPTKGLRTEGGKVFGLDASFLPGLHSRQDYIVVGKVENVNTFWNLIWEHKCAILVHICGDYQNYIREKCGPTEINAIESYNGFKIRLVKKTDGNKFVIRELKMEKKMASHNFLCFDLQVSGANVDDLLMFASQIRGKAPSGDRRPLIFQCSDGVPKAGRMIVLDYFLQYVEATGPNDVIDVFDYVLSMQRCRPGIMNNQEDYVVINAAVADMIERKYRYDTLNQGDGDHPYTSLTDAGAMDGNTSQRKTSIPFT